MRLFQNLSFLALYITSVLSQSFKSVDIIPAPLIEWDQQPYTYYTGQILNTTWTSQGFQSTDFARITYPGVGGTRTLTTGSGVLINATSYKVRLSDSSNGLATNVPVIIAESTNTTNALNSNQLITVIQSKLMNIVPLDGNRTLGGGQNTVCDDRNLTVTWRGLGEAQFGLASITLRRQGGFFGTQTLISQTNLPVSANVTFELRCPRTTTPSSSNAYAFEVSVQEPGGSAYTGTSASFNVATAPTPSPTSTSSPTSSRTPTPSNTPTPSPSVTPSPSNTPTPSPSLTSSPTSSPSMTPSTTETARPSIDYAAIARTAAESVDTTTPAVAGALGGIGGVFVLIGAVKWYQNKVMTEKRKKKLAMNARWVQQANSIYGIQPTIQDDPELPNSQPSVVMYTVANMPPRKQDANHLTSIKKGFAPKSAYK
jgi:hypothetical protein